MLLQRTNRSGSAARWLRLGEILFLLATLAARVAMAREADDAVPAEALASAEADQILLLDVQVNGHSIGKIGEFTMHNGRLMARPSELRDLGFKVPASLVWPVNG